MQAQHIDYEKLIDDAMRSVARGALTKMAENPDGIGAHHFLITFDARAEGVRLSGGHPDSLTIILQHQFYNLEVDAEAFEVDLSFGGVLERVRVPFAAITSFADPYAMFGMQLMGDNANELQQEQPQESAEIITLADFRNRDK